LEGGIVAPGDDTLFERLSLEGETRTIGGELFRNFIAHDAVIHLVGIEIVKMAQPVSLSIK
jgi:hypothetical protein